MIYNQTADVADAREGADDTSIDGTDSTEEEVDVDSCWLKQHSSSPSLSFESSFSEVASSIANDAVDDDNDVHPNPSMVSSSSFADPHLLETILLQNF